MKKPRFKHNFWLPTVLLFLLLSGCSQKAACQHEYEVITTPPTCTEFGQVTMTCTLCGDTETEQTAPPLGHNETCHVIPANCQNPERRIYTCTRCAERREEVGTQLGEHGYELTQSIPATCQSGEIQTWTCRWCGQTETRTGTEPGGHVFQTETAAPTAGAKGYTRRTCQLCGYTDEINPTYLEYGSEITFILYHEIMPRDYIRDVPGGHGMYVSIEDFRDHMRVIHEEGCFVMPLEDAVRALKGEEPIPARAVCITFDDGYKSNIEFAAPVLREYGFPAAIFMTMYYLDGDYEPIFDRRGVQRLSIEEYEPYSDLITLGCHTYGHHFDLRTCPLDELEEDLELCRELYPDYNDYFAYPIGGWNETIPPLLEEKGYQAAFTTEARRAVQGENPYAIPRFGIFGWISEPAFRNLVSGR